MSDARPLASLPMYDWPELRHATDRLWLVLAEELALRGIDVPAELDRARCRREQWRAPELVLSQTCGLPYAAHLRGTVQLVAAPCYRSNEPPGTEYHSVILVARDHPARTLIDLAGHVAAINERGSHSGWIALRAAFAKATGVCRPFATIVETGSHRASMRAVAEGEADLCAVDSLCFALAQRYDFETVRALRVVAKSPNAPGLPLITSASRPQADVTAMRAALDATLARPDAGPALDALLIDDFRAVNDADYDRIVGLKRIGDAAFAHRIAERPVA